MEDTWTKTLHTTNELLLSLDKLHTTELGAVRIRKNLRLDTAENVVEWCRTKIELPDAVITKRGKNWYIEVQNCMITVNAYSCTIITAHKLKQPEQATPQ